MKHIFIVNPAAGNGGAVTEITPAAMKALKEKGDEYEIHRSLNKQEIHDYVRSRAETGEHIRFYSCGGDGTVNDVMCGIVGCPNSELAVVPCGSGNDFVRNFSNKQYFLDMERQFNGHTMDMDIIRLGETYAINMLNIGIDCDVVIAANEARGKFIKGGASYLVGVMKVLPKAKPYKMRYVLNGETYEEELFLAAVANGRYCGGGFKSSPRSSLDDGLIDVSIIRPIKGFKLLSMLLKYHEGKHLEDKDADKYIKYFQCEKFSIEPVGEIHVSIDGEVSIFEPTDFEIMPKAIKLALPEGVDPL